MSLTNRFDKLNDPKEANNTDPKIQDGEEDIVLFDTPGHARNICFIEANGKQTFLNYAYLVSGEYNPELSEITLMFTTHTVALKGSNLEGVFEEIFSQQTKLVRRQDKRYESSGIKSEIKIFEIVIK